MAFCALSEAKGMDIKMKNKVTCLNCGQRLFDLDQNKNTSGHLEIKCSRCKKIIGVSLREIKVTVMA